MADVTWQNATYFTISGNSVTAQLNSGGSGARNGFRVCYVETAEEVVDVGDYFEFTLPNLNAALLMWVGLTWQDNPTCIPVGGATPYCYFQYDPKHTIYVDGTYTEAFTYEPTGSYLVIDDTISRTTSTVFKLQKKTPYKIEFFVDGVSVGESTSSDLLENLRLMALAGFQQDSLQPKVTASFFTGGGGDPDDLCAESWTIPTPAAFPMPSLSASNPLYVNFRELAPNWGEFGLTFPDKKPAHNTIQSTGVRRFEIDYDGLDETQAAILDGHYDSTRGGLTFTLNHPRMAETITGVRYDEYARSSHVKKWSQPRTVRLIKTP